MGKDMKRALMAMRLARIARMLVAGQENAPGSYSLGTTYRNITGKFTHPSVQGFTGTVEDATFTVTPDGLDWMDGDWKSGDWRGGKWRNGWFMNGTWHGGEWIKGMWFNGFDSNGEEHGAGDSPDKWDRKPEQRRVRLTQRPEGRRNDGDARRTGPYRKPPFRRTRDISLSDIFTDDVDEKPKPRRITPSDIFMDPQTQRTPAVQPAQGARPGTSMWRLTKVSDGRTWTWWMQSGLDETGVMKEFDKAMNVNHQRSRSTWDMFRDSDTEYSIRDENGNKKYTLVKAR